MSLPLRSLVIGLHAAGLVSGSDSSSRGRHTSTALPEIFGGVKLLSLSSAYLRICGFESPCLPVSSFGGRVGQKVR